MIKLLILLCECFLDIDLKVIFLSILVDYSFQISIIIEILYYFHFFQVVLSSKFSLFPRFSCGLIEKSIIVDIRFLLAIPLCMYILSDFFHTRSSFQRSKREAKENGTHTIEKLLSNTFARQVKYSDVYSGFVF